MRINRPGAPNTGDRKVTKSNEGPAKASGGKSKDAVVVTLGDAAKKAGAGGVNKAVAERLETVRQLISSGQYVIDRDALASAIAADELARAGR